MRTDVGREPAAMTDDGRLHLWTEMVPSRHALVTVHAATREPADADALSDLESLLGIRTYGRDMTDDLVADNRGVLRNAPLIVQDGEIGVTHTAVFDSDFNVLGSERSEVNSFEHHPLFRRLRHPCFIIHRISYSTLAPDYTSFDPPATQPQQGDVLSVAGEVRGGVAAHPDLEWFVVDGSTIN